MTDGGGMVVGLRGFACEPRQARGLFDRVLRSDRLCEVARACRDPPPVVGRIVHLPESIVGETLEDVAKVPVVDDRLVAERILRSAHLKIERRERDVVPGLPGLHETDEPLGATVSLLLRPVYVLQVDCWVAAYPSGAVRIGNVVIVGFLVVGGRDLHIGPVIEVAQAHGWTVYCDE